MDNFSGFGLGKAFRKQRTNLFRRPQNESQMLLDCPDNSSISSTPPSDSLSKVSSNDNVTFGNISRTSFSNLSDAETAPRPGVEDGNSGDSRSGDTEQNDGQIDMTKYNEGDLTASQIKDPQTSGSALCNNHSGPLELISDGAGNENKLKKLTLKVGGVTRTIHTMSVTGSSSTKCSPSSDASQPWQPKENTGGHPFNTGKAIGLRGIPWKDFSKTGFSIRRVESPQDQLPGQIGPSNYIGKYEAAHKSKPVFKRHFSGETFNGEDDEEEDDEIRYLEKLRSSKYSSSYSAGYADDDDELGSKKLRKVSRVLSQTSSGYGADFSDYNSLKASKGIKKLKSAREPQDIDYEVEEAPSDIELEPKKKKRRKEFIDFSVDGRKNMSLTTRQRALHTGEDAIGFPHGLPPPPPKKQKEQLSEVEQQLKKAEAAQRRRMQAEKAARESEAEAIRKILGQDSSRKKREDKLKKRQEELAQERNTTTAIPSNAIRWVMGPSGTVVTFPNEMGLPSIFEPKACSYPPPREKCAGPSCTNTYKYRDSKSKLPLCSLQCYKAIREKIQPLSAC